MSWAKSLFKAGTIAVLASPLAPAEPTVVWHAQTIAAWQTKSVNLADPLAVLAILWSQLPTQVDVFPSENYFYWKLPIAGKDLHGNLRLASGKRQLGTLNMGYTENVALPELQNDVPKVAIELGAAQGVVLHCKTDFCVAVTYQGKTVIFNLAQISQLPPKLPALPDETFIQRTQDESGNRFLLMYQPSSRLFYWLLDETQPAAEDYTVYAEGIKVGRRTGFVYGNWSGRQLLLAVQQHSLERNDPYDGPFDQLADNYAQQTKIQGWIEAAYPDLRGKIDVYGNYLQTEPPRRVALKIYGSYKSLQTVKDFWAKSAVKEHPIAALNSREWK